MFKRRLINNLNSNNLFCRDGDKEYSYLDLLCSVEKFASFYSKTGAKRVLLDLKQGFWGYAAIISAYLTGTVFSVLNSNWDNVHKSEIFTTFKPDVVITNDAKEMSSCDVALATIQEIDVYEKRPICECIKDNEIVYILYTSGTTGLPKGAIIRTKAIERLAIWGTKKSGVTKDDIWGQYANLFFDMSMFDVFGGAYIGCCLIPFASLSDKLRPWNKIQKEQITFINTVPQVMQLLYSVNKLNPQVLFTIKAIKIGADKISEALVSEIFTAKPMIKIILTYGPTEATVFCTYAIVTIENFRSLSNGTMTMGKPIDGITILLTDEVDGVGEITILGWDVACGYINNIANSFERLSINGKTIDAYHSGDYAQKIGDYLYFMGRNDKQIKVNGIRTSLIAIEHKIQELDIDAVESFQIDDEIILAYISKMHLEAMIEAKCRELPNYLFPRKILKLDSFPLSANGKTDQIALRNILCGMLSR
jgi:acyl-coenzyme A synthetase/AMP-(fatty) acid ligase